MSHENYMHRCFQLAKNGEGYVSPNPLVGSVIVEGGEIIGEGFHRKHGTLHAERNALAAVKDSSRLKNSTLYVNLEPCNHHGKTPPCSDAIVRSGIPHVVISNQDPHDVVAGKGIANLEAAGIKVTIGVLEKEGYWLNRRFFTFHQERRPYITLKWAESADGFIDLERNSAKDKPSAISGSEAQFLNHKWRAHSDAILIGARTAILDNPVLTARKYFTDKQPRRVILDPNNRLGGKPGSWTERDLLFQTSPVSKESIVVSTNNYLKDVLNKLFDLDVISIYVEGGAQTHRWFYDNDLWDNIRFFRSNRVYLNNGVPSLKMTGAPMKTKQLTDDELLFIKNDRFKHF